MLTVYRYVVVALLTAIGLGMVVPDMTRPFGHPMGTAGFTVGRGGRVITVDARSSAQAAGIRPGVRVDWRGTPLQSRIFISSSSFQGLIPITRFAVRVITPRGSITKEIRSQRESQADLSTVMPRVLFAVILSVAGIALVLMRPSRATWGFLFFALFSAAGPINAIVWWGPPAYQLSIIIFVAIILPLVSLAGAIIFALYLLRSEPLQRWRYFAENATYTIAVLLAASTSVDTVLAIFYGVSLEVPVIISLVLEIFGILATPVLLLATYFDSDGTVRERLRWILLGFTINAAILTVIFLTAQQLTLVAIPYWLFAALSGVSSIVVASTVVYGVLKHHVMDVNIAISRALVYTILSAIVVGIFALADLFFTRALAGRNTGLIVDMGLALVLGFFFNSLHRHIDRLVDEILFRRRHAAEQHIRTVIRGMPFAVSERQVDTMLVEEPYRGFNLGAAALLAREEGGDFEQRCAIGLPVLPSHLSSEDPLPMFLQGERCAMRLDQTRWNVHALAIAVPSHGELAAIIVYGAHENGTDFDAEERALFEVLASAAGIAYDRLEAQRLRDELRVLRLTHA